MKPIKRENHLIESSPLSNSIEKDKNLMKSN